MKRPGRFSRLSRVCRAFHVVSSDVKLGASGHCLYFPGAHRSDLTTLHGKAEEGVEAAENSVAAFGKDTLKGLHNLDDGFSGKLAHLNRDSVKMILKSQDMYHDAMQSAKDAVTESARAFSYYSVSAGSNSGTPRLCHVGLYHFWLYPCGCTTVSEMVSDTRYSM